jgi:CheY-like chemotaxis protein
MTILHVEDQPILAQMVRVALESLGFGGEILQASLVSEALNLLRERASKKAPFDLILVDMQLPDGLGLEVLQEVKASPTWRRTPVIVLSSETDPRLINEAYALGANCFLPKQGKSKGIFGAVQALYQCWMEEAYLPQTAFTGKAQEALANGVRLRARTAWFYHELARTCSADPEQEKFWIERSLNEGNKSNLLAFFQGQIGDHDIQTSTVEKTLAMQRKIEQSLKTAETLLSRQPSPSPQEICTWVLDLVESSDEEVTVEVFGALMPKNPTVTMVLRAQAAGQLRDLAGHILHHSQEPKLRQRAEALLAFAGRLSNLS